MQTGVRWPKSFLLHPVRQAFSGRGAVQRYVSQHKQIWLLTRRRIQRSGGDWLKRNAVAGFKIAPDVAELAKDRR